MDIWTPHQSSGNVLFFFFSFFCFLIFKTFFFCLFFFNPSLGIKPSPSPCGRPPPSRLREGVKLKLARRCSPFSRLLCIASAWFPSSSCWLCRRRSVPTGTGKTPGLLSYYFICIKTRSALLIGSMLFNIRDKRAWSRSTVNLTILAPAVINSHLLSTLNCVVRG